MYSQEQLSSVEDSAENELIPSMQCLYTDLVYGDRERSLNISTKLLL